jgi:prevent-host-death family protein
MKYTISATEARVHFGEVMRRATEERQPIYVEKSGKPQVVVLAVEEYELLTAQQHSPDWETQLDALHKQIKQELGDRRLPPAQEIIQQMREERDEQLRNLR